MSDLSEKDRYWTEEEYSFDLSDESDLADSLYLHLGRKFDSEIQGDGKKYVFATIEECEYPLSEMQMNFEMTVQNLQGDYYCSDIIGTGQDFLVVQELPEKVETVINNTLMDITKLYY